MKFPIVLGLAVMIVTAPLQLRVLRDEALDRPLPD